MCFAESAGLPLGTDSGTYFAVWLGTCGRSNSRWWTRKRSRTTTISDTPATKQTAGKFSNLKGHAKTTKTKRGKGEMKINIKI